MLAPLPLRPGDRVAVIAPSSPFDAEKFQRGVERLRARYDVRVRDDVLAREGYLAGSDARRREELRDAIVDPAVRAILAARGGFGATRIVHELDWASFAGDPKWVVGFSDVTALHVEAARVGVRSIHGPMVAFMGGDEGAFEAVRAVLEGAPVAPWDGLEPVVVGEATGPSFGGNLALLETCAASGRLRVPEGAIVFLEDCTERPYRLDRMLTALRVGGHFARAAGVVIGGLTDCTPGPDGVTAEQVVREHLQTIGVPAAMGAPFGHGETNRPFVLGAPTRLVVDATGRVSFDG
jgi:muramoyltetrapeptide carboxypeptidase